MGVKMDTNVTDVTFQIDICDRSSLQIFITEHHQHFP